MKWKDLVELEKLIIRDNEAVMKKYTCPHCGEDLTEEEAEQTCDEGCPCCRHIIEWDDEM